MRPCTVKLTAFRDIAVVPYVVGFCGVAPRNLGVRLNRVSAVVLCSGEELVAVFPWVLLIPSLTEDTCLGPVT